MVLPLYDENPLKLSRPPVVTWTLIAINIIVFLIMIASPDAKQAAIYAGFATVPEAVIAHPIGWPGATLVTGIFLHGGWEHILGNMIYLWVFGDDIEDALGPVRFLAFYLLTGLAASLAFVMLNPNSTVPLVGASGAISGVLAAYLMLRPCAKVSVLVLRIVVRMRAFWVIGGWVLLQLIMLAGNANDGVAYVAHLGGLVAGAVLFLVMRPAGVVLFECIDPPEASAAPATGT